MEARNIRADILAALDGLSAKQVTILQKNKVYNNSQLKAGEKQEYYNIELEKKQLNKMLGDLDKLETGFKMYQDIAAAKAKSEAEAPAAPAPVPAQPAGTAAKK